MRALSLILVLSFFWLVSSGHSTPLMLGLMASAILLVVGASLRLSVLDKEGHPTHLLGRAPSYWGWLIVQVVKSNLAVLRAVFGPRSALAPRLVRVPISQTDDLGRTIHANSATLTPGTVACDVQGGVMTVHCLTAANAEELMAGELDRRVTRFLGGRSQ